MNTVGNERVLQRADHYISENVRQTLGARVLPIGSIVFPKVGGAIATNKKRLLATPSCVDNNVMGLTVKSDQLTSEFLAWWMHSADIYEFSNKAALPSITKSTVSAWPFPLPPLEEQKRIVAVLDAAFEGLTRARTHIETNLQNARELFDSHLFALFDNHDPSWNVAPLLDYCTRITVGHVGPMKDKYVTNGIPFLRSQNVRPFSIDLQDVKFIEQEFADGLSKSKLTPGDVAIVRTGYPGTCAVIPDYLEIAYCADLVVATPGENLDPNFMALMLNSAYGKKLVAGASVGAAQKHFNVGAAKKAKFPIPSLEIQKSIVAKAGQIKSVSDDLASICVAKLQDLDDLRQSLLQKAFAGELT